MRHELTSLVLATGNKGKVRELCHLLTGVPVELRNLNDFPGIVPVDETGDTFRENAELKASGLAVQTGHYALADDSGLEVEALKGAPGVRSARFAGEDSGYDSKMATLLAMLDETGDTARRARFVCVMAVADRDGRVIHVAEGICNGSIAAAPRGSGGFGYDPIFIPDGFDHTFAELGDDVKQRISHRAKATALIIRYLLHFIAGLT